MAIWNDKYYEFDKAMSKKLIPTYCGECEYFEDGNCKAYKKQVLYKDTPCENGVKKL